MAGREELVGRDVIVVHRLLKNSVQETLGLGAYALYTDDCVRAMGLGDPGSSGLIEHRETYEFVGDVTGWVRDLSLVWQEAEAGSAVIVRAEDAAWSTSFDFPAPPAVTWEWVTSPARRLQWQVGVSVVDEDVVGGRRGVGTMNHCVHGRDAIVEEVLAWQPPEVLTTRFQMPIPGIPKFTRSEFFEPIDGGTHTRFTVRVLRPSAAKDRAKLDGLGPMLSHAYVDGLAVLSPMVEADVAARAAAAAAAPPEPNVPVSAGRNLVPMPGQ